MERIMLHLVTVLFVITRLASGQIRGDTAPDPKYIDEAGQIVTTIFHKYKEGVPPRRDYPKPVLLGVNLRVEHVRRLDAVAKVLESTVLLEVTWKDSRLSWYPLAVKEITITQDKIWSPTISIDNAVEPPGVIDNPKFVIKSNGDIYSYKRLYLKTSCETNLTSSNDNCTYVIGSNLLNDKILDFDLNASGCDVADDAASHDLSISFVGARKQLEERRMLKENATFPEFVCTYVVSHQELPNDAVIIDSNYAQSSTCCTNSAFRLNTDFHELQLMLSTCLVTVLTLALNHSV